MGDQEDPRIAAIRDAGEGAQMDQLLQYINELQATVQRLSTAQGDQQVQPQAREGQREMQAPPLAPLPLAYPPPPSPSTSIYQINVNLKHFLTQCNTFLYLHLFRFFITHNLQYDKTLECLNSKQQKLRYKTIKSTRRDHHKDIDPVLSLRLCLDGLQPEVCLDLSFNKDIPESELRDDRLRLLEL